MTARDVTTKLQEYASDYDAQFLQRFFKTGQGQYGEGDVFIGVRVPATRAVCKQFSDLPLAEIQKLLDSPVHEHRLAAVILLANQYKKAKADTQKRQDIFNLYLANVKAGRVNNWDIVDCSAEHIIGPHMEHTDRRLLFELAKSDVVWQRRVGVMSAFCYLKHDEAVTTLKLAEVLLHDPHDLIQKAVGWQLREVGKKCGQELLTGFLDKHAATMPRTMLRYAIEHLQASQRAHYMGLKVRNS